MSVWFKSCLNPWYIWIPSNPNLYSTKIIMKMRWQTIASNVSIRTISPTATPLPKTYDCVAVYIAGRRTSLVVYGWWPQPPTKKSNLVKSQCHGSLPYAAVRMDYIEVWGNNHYKWRCALTHSGRDNMAAIFQTKFWNAFSLMKIYEFRLRFHWSLFPRVQLTIFQQWYR